MSGSRAKALRADFIARFHRVPRRAGWSPARAETVHYRSRVKTRLGWLLGKAKKLLLRTVEPRTPSEWRRYKRAWKRGGIDALEAIRRAA